MAASAVPKPEDRLAFADELAQIRAKDVKNKYKKELNELEVEYQFILLRSLTLFHKEMLRAKLPDRLYEIKENLTDTVGTFYYQTNLFFFFFFFFYLFKQQADLLTSTTTILTNLTQYINNLYTNFQYNTNLQYINCP